MPQLEYLGTIGCLKPRTARIHRHDVFTSVVALPATPAVQAVCVKVASGLLRFWCLVISLAVLGCGGFFVVIEVLCNLADADALLFHTPKT